MAVTSSSKTFSLERMRVTPWSGEQDRASATWPWVRAAWEEFCGDRER